MLSQSNKHQFSFIWTITTSNIFSKYYYFVYSDLITTVFQETTNHMAHRAGEKKRVVLFSSHAKKSITCSELQEKNFFQLKRLCIVNFLHHCL